MSLLPARRRPALALALCAATLALTGPAADTPESPADSPAAALPYQDASLAVPAISYTEKGQEPTWHDAAD